MWTETDGRLETTGSCGAVHVETLNLQEEKPRI